MRIPERKKVIESFIRKRYNVTRTKSIREDAEMKHLNENKADKMESFGLFFVICDRSASKLK